jgi:hypothetical protein
MPTVMLDAVRATSYTRTHLMPLADALSYSENLM